MSSGYRKWYEKNAVILNLSILNNEDVILRSDNFEWNKEVEILRNQKYNIRLNISILHSGISISYLDKAVEKNYHNCSFRDYKFSSHIQIYIPWLF